MRVEAPVAFLIAATSISNVELGFFLLNRISIFFPSYGLDLLLDVMFDLKFQEALISEFLASLQLKPRFGGGSLGISIGRNFWAQKG